MTSDKITVGEINGPWGVRGHVKVTPFTSNPNRLKTNAIVMALSFAFAAFSPVAPYIFLEGSIALALSVISTAIALIFLSAWRSYLTSGKFFKQAFEMLFLAAIAVIASNIIGRLVGQTIF